MDVDAVFCSTSESSDNEIPMPVQPRSGPFPVFKPSPPTLLYRQSGSSKSPFSMTQSHLQSHRTSQSPVVPLAASSASSRSREDIISWARAVGVRPGQINGFTSQGEDADTKRGRSRTRRTEALARITPPIDEPLDEHDESHAAAGTTPKGRVASASAGLHIGNSGGGPIVKALTSVTVPNTPSDTKPIGLGLQAVPAATEVSRVDVITSTTPAVGESKGTLATFYNPGATPTLSSISFSEAMDPSIITDNPEHIDVVTDDQQSSSSYFALRRAPCPPQSRQPQPQPQPQIQRQQLPGPLRPIATTASAIWHIGTYLGSFSPFGIPSIVKPYVPKSIAGIPMPSPRDSPSKTFGVPKASPMPAVRADTPTESSVPEIVRSLPLNIIMPEGGKGKKVELSRGREVFDRSRSRSRSDSRSRRRQVSRSPSAIREVDARGRGYAHKWSYDADASDGEGEEPRRGRSRRGKALNREAPRQASDELVTRSPSSSEGRGRGRKRTVRPL